MNNNLFFFSQLNKTSVCKYYFSELQLTLLRAVPTLKQRNKPKDWLSHCADQSLLPFPARMIQKSRALLFLNHNYIVAAGKYSDHGPLQFYIGGTR